MDSHYPDIETTFLHDLIASCGKCIDITTVGLTTSYTLEGEGSIKRRRLFLRGTTDGKVDYIYATAIAIKLGCIGQLLKYLEDKKNWKDGGYTDQVN